MRRILIGLISCTSVIAPVPALAQGGISEAQLADIETTFAGEIAAFDKQHPPTAGQDAATLVRQLIRETPDKTRALMAGMGMAPSDREVFVTFRDGMRMANPGMLGPAYVCAAERRIAQLDGASLIAPQAKPAPPPGPLGLQGSTPAQTGPLAPATGERYFLKGEVIQTDYGECDPFCPRTNTANMIIHTSEIPNTRFSGAVYLNRGEFGFGDPMHAGATWRVELVDRPPGDFYECSGENGGTVGENPRGPNIAFAPTVITIQCNMTAEGRAEFHRLRCDKERSDSLLSGEPPKHCPA